jgi:ZIP family zinc transporter
MASMSTAQLWTLGAIAGFTIFLGLPIGRLPHPAPRLRAFLNAIAIGILLFLFFDILAHANEIVEDALTSAKDEGSSWWLFVWYALLLAAGLLVGLVGLVRYEQRLTKRATRSVSAAVNSLPPSTTAGRLDRVLADDAMRVALYIAIGIGLHNFAEGLAIGQSAARGDISLAVLLVIGFGLHNATEGFGIVAPMAAEGRRASTGFLVVLGLIGGGPTFVGTIVGDSFVNDALYLVFLALAAGSILYVTMQLVQVASRLGWREVFAWGVLIGLLAGLATDYVLVAAGA